MAGGCGFAKPLLKLSWRLGPLRAGRAPRGRRVANMREPLFNPGMFSGRAPLFPLPGVVLYPQMLLPLHVFEPRYLRMLEVVLDGERLIGIVQLKELFCALMPTAEAVTGVDVLEL